MNHISNSNSDSRRMSLCIGMPVFVFLCFIAVRSLFFEVGHRWTYILLFSAALSASLTPLSRLIAFHFGALDRPGGHKIHKEPTALLGGIPILFGFVLPLLVNGIFTCELTAIVLAALVLFVVGAVDDVRNTPASWKLAIQVVLAIGLNICGVRLTILPESSAFGLLFNGILSTVWIVGITNAMNFFDGMDGLATGLGGIIAFFLALVAHRMGTPFEGWASLAMLGSCAGFLPYNFRPGKRATIFLGDAGSTVIGFVLASLAIYTSWDDLKPVVSIASPLLIFGLLILDMCYITLFRIIQGNVRNFRQWIDYVGHDHLHHRIASVLGGTAQSVFFIYILSICLGLSALLLPHLPIGDAYILLAQAALIFLMVSVLERKGRSIANNGKVHTLVDS